MKTVYDGHTYLLDHLDGDGQTLLQFVQRAPHHHPKEGTTNQEVCRALIDRVKLLDSEQPWEGNDEILFHLRMVIALHEIRAMTKHIEKGELAIEHAKLGEDGHLDLSLSER